MVMTPWSDPSDYHDKNGHGHGEDEDDEYAIGWRKL